MRRKWLWSEGVGRDPKTGERQGSIIAESMPMWVWLIDIWLNNADEVLHTVERRLPVDARGWSAIDRLSYSWANPFCAANLYAWGRIRERFTKQEVFVDIPFTNLSKRTRDWYLKDMNDARQESADAPPI